MGSTGHRREWQSDSDVKFVQHQRLKIEQRFGSAASATFPFFYRNLYVGAGRHTDDWFIVSDVYDYWTGIDAWDIR